MRPAWRLAINSLSARRSRSALLVGAVALSAALIACVCCATASIHKAVGHQLSTTIGAADARIKPAGSGTPLPAAILDEVRSWPEVADAAPRLNAAVALSVTLPVLLKDSDSDRHTRKPTPFTSTALAQGINPQATAVGAGRSLTPPPDLIAGRLPVADDEIVIDGLLAYRLSYEYATSSKQRDGFIPLPFAYTAPDRSQPIPENVESAEAAARINARQGVGIGDELEFVRQTFPVLDLGIRLPTFKAPPKLKVVGVAASPPLGGRAQCYLPLKALATLTEQPGLTQIDILAKPGVKPDDLVTAHISSIPQGLILETSERVTSGLDRNLQSSQLGLVLATVMAFMSAAFIITTGLTTSVNERQRELAILRCIGGTPRQLATMQVIIGGVLGVVGAMIGVPLGVGIAALLATIFRDQLPQGLVIPAYGVALASVGSVASGLIGAGWPAWRTSKVSPLAALVSRAAPPRASGVAIVGLVAAACLLYQVGVISLNRDVQVMFWMYATSALPAMFLGYFLLGVPVTLAVAWLLAPVLSKALRLPPRVLGRTIAATPYRHGLTAGALMGGLALMVALWTNGGAMLRDWLDKIRFPDAFVSGIALTEDNQRHLESMTDLVKRTSAITIYNVETDAFGVRALQTYKTSFIGFEPEAFFELAALTWVQGDQQTALARLKQGNAVIVAREFFVAQGLGVGSQFVCRSNGREHRFEIVGVVASPGLELISQFFNVGQDYTEQAVHAVFGSRDDMKTKFFGGEPAPIQLITIQFTDAVKPSDDPAAIARIRRELFGTGILDAGSGRMIKEEISTFARGMLVAISVVAMVAMLVACFGVANLVVAGIDARRFEFGVLRAIGAQRGILTRLILAEAAIVALAACILGTAMGLQGSWAGTHLHGGLLGLSLNLQPPPIPIAIGWVVTILLTLAAAWPAVSRLNRLRPRDLLGTMKG